MFDELSSESNFRAGYAADTLLHERVIHAVNLWDRRSQVTGKQELLVSDDPPGTSDHFAGHSESGHNQEARLPLMFAFEKA